MINSLKIRNFQSHRKSFLEFDSGVNIIVGSSDSGKSAIIRALRWLIWNRPLGDEIRSNWGGPTEVTVQVDDLSIKRIKTSSEAGYRLNESEFNAIGTKVPDEIITALNIADVNLQKQLDSPFLLSETSGEIAQYFNKIANLDKIDLGRSRIDSQIKSIKTELAYDESKLEADQKELANYDYLDKFEAEIEVLEDMENRLTQKQKQLSELNKLISQFEKTVEKIDKLNPILLLEKPLGKILDLIAQKRDAETQYDQFNRIVKNYNLLGREIEISEGLIKLEKPINSIIALIEKKDELTINRNKLRKLVVNAQELDENLLLAENLYNKLHTEFEKQFPDVCPLCGK